MLATGNLIEETFALHLLAFFRIHRAYIPELGLSNKPASLMSSAEQSEMDARGVDGIDWTASPLEGQLADWTIWPGSSESVDVVLKRN